MPKDNHFIVIVPVYNAVKWIGKCLDSIISQSYANFNLLVIDDHSTDGTWDVIKSYGINAIQNKERIGSALANIIHGIELIAKNDEDIIVTVDGDDYLHDDNVLSYLNTIYQDDIWLTYGSFLPVSGKFKNTCQELGNINEESWSGKDIIHSCTPKTYRESGMWVTSHLRTFKKWLWDKIIDTDLRDRDGKYFKVAWDLAFMYPMIEMADTHIKFIDKILYMYNDLNPICDGTIDPTSQISTGKYIQSKPIYNSL